MLFKLIILILFSVAPFQVFAQSKQVPQVPKTEKSVLAAAELDSVIAEAGKLSDKLAIVEIRSRAAALVALSDPARSEIMFLDVWKFAKAQPDNDFDKEQAANLILKYLFPKNQKLAKRLFSEISELNDSSLQSRATGQDPDLRRVAKLASELIESDPSASAALLERSLSTGVSAAGLGALLRLRDRDSLLADFVVVKAFDSLRSQPTVVSLMGLYLLTAYAFPERSSVEVDPSLQSLQFQYFSTTYDVLRSSLAESDAGLAKDPHYTPAALRLRQISQGQVAAVLAALAPRFQPGLSQELDLLANKLAAQLPPGVARVSQFTAQRLSGDPSADPESALALAILKGDFDEADRLIEDLKNEDLKKAYSQSVIKIQTKSLLAKGDVLGAVSLIRKVTDQPARLILYLEALRAAQKKRDAPLSSLVIAEARTLIPQSEKNGLHVRALLAFAAQLSDATSIDEAAEFLTSAVTAINALPTKVDDTSEPKPTNELALDELSNPRSLIDAPEMERAFSTMGRLDMNRATAEARRIEVKPVQLVARLEAIQDVLKSAAGKRRSTKTVAIIAK